MNELSIEAKPENLDAVQNFVAGNLESIDCSVKLRHQIAIAVEEIFVNIAHYAYSPEIGWAVIHISINGEKEITIEFKDGGKPYDPLENEDPNITQSAEEREIGGLGVFMVKKIMDQVDYKRVGNNNILTLRKKLS